MIPFETSCGQTTNWVWYSRQPNQAIISGERLQNERGWSPKRTLGPPCIHPTCSLRRAKKSSVTEFRDAIWNFLSWSPFFDHLSSVSSFPVKLPGSCSRHSLSILQVFRFLILRPNFQLASKLRPHYFQSISTQSDIGFLGCTLQRYAIELYPTWEQFERYLFLVWLGWTQKSAAPGQYFTILYIFRNHPQSQCAAFDFLFAGACAIPLFVGVSMPFLH